MRIEDYVEKIFPINCDGRDEKGHKVLSKSIKVELKVYLRPGSNTISSEIKCPYNRGNHGEICSASYFENSDNKREEINCPYSF